MCLLKFIGKNKLSSQKAADAEKKTRKKSAAKSKKRRNKVYIPLSKSQTEAVLKDWFIQVNKDGGLYVHHYFWEYEDCMGEKCDWEQVIELPYNNALYFEKDRHISFYFDDGHLALPLNSEPLKRYMITMRML